jgi:hypothetical protein
MKRGLALSLHLASFARTLPIWGIKVIFPRSASLLAEHNRFRKSTEWLLLLAASLL